MGQIRKIGKTHKLEKIESLVKSGIIVCITIPVLGYILIIMMIIDTFVENGSVMSGGEFLFSDSSVLSPIALLTNTVVSFISILTGLFLDICLLIIFNRINYRHITIQAIELLLLLLIVNGKINDFPIVWILFD